MASDETNVAASLGPLAERAVTLGLATIMRAREVVVIVSGRGKRLALQRLMDGPIGPGVPASILRGLLVPMLVGFGMGSGAPKRQPLRVPVHVPPGHAERHMPPVLVPVLQSAFTVHGFPLSVLVGGPTQVRPGRHGAPGLVPPTQAVYSGSLTVEEVQVRLVTPVSAVVVGPNMSAPVVGPHAVILVKEVPMSGITEGSGVPTPAPPK